MSSMSIAAPVSNYMSGVNLGGWMVMESWMDPDDMGIHGFMNITGDEWTLVKHLGGPTSEKAIQYMQNHWEKVVTADDLDTLVRLGITHARIPVGWWLVDYDVADGFVDGGKVYLEKVLKMMQARNMHAILDLHALPGAQTALNSFTGKIEFKAHFFEDPKKFERGMGSILKLAEYAKSLESKPGLEKVVVGIELVNEPSGSYMDQLKSLYTSMVPLVRAILPADRYSILLNFMDAPQSSGPWLAEQIAKGPSEVWTNVIYDKHLYHAYGDDDFPYAHWDNTTDTCKSCCRDPVLLEGLSKVPFVIGEWSLTSGSHSDPDPKFLRSFWHAQQSFHRSVSVGSFFWNLNLRTPKGGSADEFVFFNLMRLAQEPVSLPGIHEMDLSSRCPAEDLARCPKFTPEKVQWNDKCKWLPKQSTSVSAVVVV